MARDIPSSSASGSGQLKRDQARAARGGGCRRIVLALLIGIVLALAVTAYLTFGTRTGSASVAAQSFCAALAAHDYTRAYGQLSDRLRREGTAAQFATSQRTLDQLNGAPQACTFSDPRIQSTSATFTLHITRAHGRTSSGALLLIEAHGIWQVDGYDANVI